MNTKTSHGMTFTIRSATLRNRRVGVSAAIGIFAAGSLLAASPVSAALLPAAQATSDVAGTVSVVAENLDNPRGLAFGPHGELYIAEAGHGGSLCLGEGPEGPQCAGLTSGISKLAQGELTKVVDHLISLASPVRSGGRR